MKGRGSSDSCCWFAILKLKYLCRLHGDIFSLCQRPMRGMGVCVLFLLFVTGIWMVWFLSFSKRQMSVLFASWLIGQPLHTSRGDLLKICL